MKTGSETSAAPRECSSFSPPSPTTSESLTGDWERSLPLCLQGLRVSNYVLRLPSWWTVTVKAFEKTSTVGKNVQTELFRFLFQGHKHPCGRRILARGIVSFLVYADWSKVSPRKPRNMDVYESYLLGDSRFSSIVMASSHATTKTGALFPQRFWWHFTIHFPPQGICATRLSAGCLHRGLFCQPSVYLHS